MLLELVGPGIPTEPALLTEPGNLAGEPEPGVDGCSIFCTAKGESIYNMHSKEYIVSAMEMK